MRRTEQPVRVVVERREIEDPAGELELAQLLVGMLDRRRVQNKKGGR